LQPVIGVAIGTPIPSYLCSSVTKILPCLRETNHQS
jgi:hypothetical protein